MKRIINKNNDPCIACANKPSLKDSCSSKGICLERKCYDGLIQYENLYKFMEDFLNIKLYWYQKALLKLLCIYEKTDFRINRTIIKTLKEYLRQ